MAQISLAVLVGDFAVPIMTKIHSYAQTTAIPDPNFEQALIDLGIDKDFTVNGKVANENIENITELKVFDKQISDLTGIEGFIKLNALRLRVKKMIEGAN